MSSENGDGKTSGLRKRARKTITLSDGLEVVIRPVGLSILAQVQGALPDVQALAGGDDEAAQAVTQRARRPEVAADLDRMIDAALMEGVVSPKLGTDPVTDDVPRDFGVDRFVLFKEILALSGYSREAAERVRPLSDPSA